jgi:predicted GIY-YIG superfamily endonuclease
MSFWVYILRCSDGRYYTGQTDDLDVRLAQHQQGFFANCWTFKRRPLELVWSEALPTRDEALAADRMVGGWSRAKEEALIRGNWKLVSYLSCPPAERVTRFSTSLETNGGGLKPGEHSPPLASSEVEKPNPAASPPPLASSEVEKPILPGKDA